MKKYMYRERGAPASGSITIPERPVQSRTETKVPLKQEEMQQHNYFF
jgi:hypothetical protein